MQLSEQSGIWRRIGRKLKTLVLGFFPLIMMLAFVLQAAREEPAAGAAKAESAPATQLESYSRVQFTFGRGYIGDGWQLYFNEPDASAVRESYAGGIDTALAAAIARTQDRLDIAAFEMNSEAIYQAILAAHRRGVAVRIIADDEHGLYDSKNEALRNLQAEGIAVVDDARSGLMHNKYMILDSRTVWTGSWNYTVNGTYRNNNNALVLENALAVAALSGGV